jgi:uncharacterized protein YggE
LTVDIQQFLALSWEDAQMQIDIKRLLTVGLPITLSLILAFVLGSQSGSKSDSAYLQTVAFSATGYSQVVPDAIKLSVTATVIKKSSALALSDLAKTSDQVREVLTANQIAAEDFSSTNLSLIPEYTYGLNGARSFIGYRASQNFEITIKDSDNAGVVIDKLVAAGKDNLQIGSISSFLLDPSRAIEEARADSMKQARAKAESYAKLANLKLGRILSINENYDQSPQPMALAKSDSAAGTSFDMGTQKLSVTTYISWEIK